MAQAAKPAENRAPDTIESEIEATRDRLAVTIDQLVYRASPKTIVKRNVQGIKHTFVDARGLPRADNILKTVGVIAGFVTVMLVIRKVAK